MTAARRHIRPRRGAALLIVLWTAALISMLLAIAVASARIEAKISAVRVERLRAETAMRSALEFAAYKLATGDQDVGRRAAILSDFELDGYTVNVSQSDEAGKLDINAADEIAWTTLLMAHGMERADAEKLAAKIADWRDLDDLARPNGAEQPDYARANRTIGNRSFHSVSELGEVLDFPMALLDCLRGEVTLFGGNEGASGGLAAESAAGPISLGTSARGAAPGRRFSLVATAVRASSKTASPWRMIMRGRIISLDDAPFAIESLAIENSASDGETSSRDCAR